jgi:hypothetical protein
MESVENFNRRRNKEDGEQQIELQSQITGPPVGRLGQQIPNSHGSQAKSMG